MAKKVVVIYSVFLVTVMMVAVYLFGLHRQLTPAKELKFRIG